jgi:hypothetical protein
MVRAMSVRYASWSGRLCMISSLNANTAELMAFIMTRSAFAPSGVIATRRLLPLDTSR